MTFGYFLPEEDGYARLYLSPKGFGLDHCGGGEGGENQIFIQNHLTNRKEEDNIFLKKLYHKKSIKG